MIATLFFGENPRLLLIDILICTIGQGDDFTHCALEIARFVEGSNRIAGTDKLIDKRGLTASSTDFVVEAFAQEPRAATRDIHYFANKIAVNSLYKILEIQVHVVDIRAEFGGKVIAEILRVEMIKVGGRHNKRTAAFRHFGPIYG